MREINLTDTLIRGNKEHALYEKNEPLCVYDTSGFQTDENGEINVHKGIPRLRESWIDARNDVEFLTSNSSTFAQQRLADEGVDSIRFEHLPQMRIAKKGKNVTKMLYPPKGFITVPNPIFQPHNTVLASLCRLLLEKKKTNNTCQRQMIY